MEEALIDTNKTKGKTKTTEKQESSNWTQKTIEYAIALGTAAVGAFASGLAFSAGSAAFGAMTKSRKPGGQVVPLKQVL